MNRQLGAVVFYFNRSKLVYNIPGHIERILICQSIEHAVTAEDDEIMEVRSHSELRDLRLRNNNSFLAAILM